MKYIQEKYADDLYKNLLRRFSGERKTLEASIEGGGVRVKCAVKGSQISCTTHCFESKGPEFLTFFIQEAKENASARTSSQSDCVEAIADWLNDASLEGMYNRFKFVDQQKRAMEYIRDVILKNFPEVASTEIELKHWGSAIYYLWFRSATRSAQLYFYGKNEFPDAVFHWDQCPLFTFSVNNNLELGVVLKRWLADNAAPSAMRKEFAWLNIRKLADYYEKGNPIVGEFIESWEQIQEFYGGLNFPPRPLVLQFISELTARGYDQKLRAGQSMFTFILSRSRRHRLRPEQPMIKFDFDNNTMEMTVRIQGEAQVTKTSIGLSEHVETALEQLVRQTID